MARMIGEYSEDFLRERAVEFVDDKTKSSRVLNTERENLIPKLDPSELTFGKELGRGGFCTVFEVKRVHLNGNEPFETTTASTADDSDDDDNHFSHDFVLQDRQFIATKYIRAGGKGARYAVKTMTQNIDEPTRFLGGVMDLAIETRFLAVLRHPNIIKMRAMATIDPYKENYFIVLDRLYDTLTDRLAAWKTSKKNTKGFYRVRDLKGDKKKALWIDRVLVAHDVCSALRYLHCNRIVYRDLKPDNIGFDVRGDVKLFDFGLAKELTEDDLMEDDVYKLSGKTGSLRYMAPEVAKEEPYNISVDVYSFTILLWQICSLETPFASCNVKTHFQTVVKSGLRPQINPKWSKDLSQLMTNGWSEDMQVRPDCGHIMDILRMEVDPFLGDTENNLLDQSNRTAASLEALD